MPNQVFATQTLNHNQPQPSLAPSRPLPVPPTIKQEKLTEQEENMMENITKNNTLMRRKLKTDHVEHKKRVPIKVYVKDSNEITDMRKKLKELEKVKEMYKNRVVELEQQVSSFSVFHMMNNPDSKRSLPNAPTDGSQRKMGQMNNLSIPVDMHGDLMMGKMNQVAPAPQKVRLLALYDYNPNQQSSPSSQRSSPSSSPSSGSSGSPATPKVRNGVDPKGRLAFKEGEVLTLIKKSKNGWWTAEINGKVGKIPSNYVEELETKREFKVRVIKSYESQQFGDLSIKRGELLTILKKQANGWYLAGKGDKTGFVPTKNVEKLPTPAS